MPAARSFHRGTALLVAGAFFMENLDGTIIQTAAPAMAADLGVEATAINLAMVAYLMTVAVFIPATGWLADRFGTRRTFTVAVVLFTVASLACAFAPTLGFLVAARVAQGIGGALMVPVGRLVILRTTAKQDLLPAFAYLTWPGLMAPVLAPVLGGFLAQTVGWEWIFLINVPLGVLALVAGHWLLPRGEALTRPRFDGWGFGVLACGLAALTAGAELVGSGSSGNSLPDGEGSGSAPFLGLGFGAVGAIVLGVGVALCVLAVVLIRRATTPLLRFGALRFATFRVGNVSGTVYRLLISAVPFLVTLWLQLGLGYSPVAAGTMVIAIFVGNIAIKPLTTPIIRLFGFKTTLVGSNALGLLIIAGFAFMGVFASTGLILVMLFFSGVFRSIGFTAYNTVQFVDVPAAGMNDANTLSSTLQQVGTALGIAVVTLAVRVGEAVVPGSSGDSGGSGAELGAFSVAFLICAGIMVIPLVGSIVMPRGSGAEAARRG
jgi:MFS family permease